MLDQVCALAQLSRVGWLGFDREPPTTEQVLDAINRLDPGDTIEVEVSFFLGGLSLHLNHLIGSRVTNYDWPFGTLPFGLFGSNLDTRDLETYPRTYSGHF